MGTLITIEEVDSFRQVLDYGPETVSADALATVRDLDERNELEPFLRTILTDVGETPHGPAEIVDILTHKVSVRSKAGIAAFILKGKSFPIVRPQHVGHQIYRLEKITDLSFAFFAAAGTILDQAKEQFIATASRVSEHYGILDAVDLARVLIAYGFICPRDGRRISAGRCMCGYSPEKRILNILQQEALKELGRARALGQVAGLVILPPGSGKTRIAAEDAKRAQTKRLLYVAQTHEILNVAESEFTAVFGSKAVTYHHNAESLVTPNVINIATIHLLRGHLDVLSYEIDYLVVDEFHHVAARSYRSLLDAVKPGFLLGLTATPFRGDRQDITELCSSNIIVNYELRAGINLGVLTPYHYYGCFDDVDYSKIRHNGTEYNIRDLERALVIPARDKAIIQKWKELGDGKPTIAFCCTQKHAERAAANFRSHGIAAETYIASTNPVDRARIQKRLQSGDLRVLCTVDVLNEGADFPYVDCLLFLRPTESAQIFYQQLGRGLRKYAGKSHCTVIDFIGNFKNAYKIVEYQGLLPDPSEPPMPKAGTITRKDLLNLPLGCRVEFDGRVIDIFARQSLDPRFATRHNIGRILIYQYQKLSKTLGKKPTARDVDRTSRLSSELYRLVFGSWKHFARLMDSLESE